MTLLPVEFAWPGNISAPAGRLLPYRFTLTPPHVRGAISSLLHLSSGRPARLLAGTVPYGVRTFLTLVATRATEAQSSSQLGEFYCTGARGKNVAIVVFS